ncbi:MAG: nitroreductase family protein [Magnetococcales bacterium]|nr:nitroreductase family protein [Magnetococcales bacterium]
MDTATAITTRRSIKHFDPEHRMTRAEIEQLLTLTCHSPTSFNIQHWRFVVVDDVELRRQMRKVAWNQAQITDSSVLVVLCADVHAWDKQPERYWQHVAEPVRQFMVPAIGQHYRGQEQLQRDEAFRSCGIAAQTLMLAAKEMGYDTCPIAGFNVAAVADLIHLPNNHLVTLIIAVGKPLQPPWPAGSRLPLEQCVFYNRFPDSLP